ncbi:unnamed protein product [Arctogadus glacialis]
MAGFFPEPGVGWLGGPQGKVSRNGVPETVPAGPQGREASDGQRRPAAPPAWCWSRTPGATARPAAPPPARRPPPSCAPSRTTPGGERRPTVPGGQQQQRGPPWSQGPQPAAGGGGGAPQMHPAQPQQGGSNLGRMGQLARSTPALDEPVEVKSRAPEVRDKNVLLDGCSRPGTRWWRSVEVMEAVHGVTIEEVHSALRRNDGNAVRAEAATEGIRRVRRWSGLYSMSLCSKDDLREDPVQIPVEPGAGQPLPAPSDREDRSPAPAPDREREKRP